MPVTPDDVRTLNKAWEHLENQTIQPYIDDAGLILADLIPADTAYTVAHQDALQKWLSAHLLSMRDDEYRLLRDRVADAEQEYPPHFGPGLRSSKWGQQLLVLDTEGVLEGAGLIKAQFRVIYDESS